MTDFVGWSGLVNTLVIVVLLGLQRTAAGLTLRPHLPPAAAGLRFALSLPRDGLTVELEVLADGAVRGASRGPDAEGRFAATFGDTVVLRAAGRAAAGEPA